MKFKPGDIVFLKSGGPEMTVAQILWPWTSIIVCTWFQAGECYEDQFYAVQLRPNNFTAKEMEREGRS